MTYETVGDAFCRLLTPGTSKLTYNTLDLLLLFLYRQVTMLSHNEANIEFPSDRIKGCETLLRDVVNQDRPWQVLHVRSNFEKRVAQHLVVRQVEYYLPLYKDKVKWTDRSVVIERPLFAGYVFVQFSPEERINVISVPGVVRWLGDETGNLVSCSELAKIRDGLDSGLLMRPHPRISAGTRVRIRTGVFEGVEGVVTEFRQQCKVVITLSAVQQCFSLEVGLEDIEVVKMPAPKLKRISTGAGGNWRLQAAKI
jgi:transcription antitermination factor NusG